MPNKSIHTLELPRLPVQSDGSAAWDWCKFIGVQTEEELTMLATKNETLKGAVDELYRLSAKDDVRWEYEAREKAWRDERARLNFATKQGETVGEARGIKKGIKKGIVKGHKDILDLLRNGAAPADILRQYEGE